MTGGVEDYRLAVAGVVVGYGLFPSMGLMISSDDCLGFFN